MTEKQILEAKRAYMRAYKKKWNAKNREKVRAYARKWRKNNPEKVKEYNDRFWARQALGLIGMENVTVTQTVTQTVTDNANRNACEMCGEPVSNTRARFCSPACKQKHYRLAQKKKNLKF